MPDVRKKGPHHGLQRADLDLEEFQLLAIEAGAEDIKDDIDPIEIVTSPDAASNVKTALEENGYTLSYELNYIPSNSLKVSGLRPAGF